MASPQACGPTTPLLIEEEAMESEPSNLDAETTESGQTSPLMDEIPMGKEPSYLDKEQDENSQRTPLMDDEPMGNASYDVDKEVSGSSQTSPLMEEHEPMGTECDLDLEKGESPEAQTERALSGISSIRSIMTVGILAYIYLIIYIQRCSITGVLPYLHHAFHIGDSVSGLISTVYICSHILAALFCGYMGDRWNRKIIMSVGIGAWTITTLGMSFIPNELFSMLLLASGLVGAADASFSTIAPSIIADLYVADQRSRMLTIFHVMIPVGCGLGHIIGSQIPTIANGNWQWAFRVTPALGLIAIVLMVFVMKEPPRHKSASTINIKSNSSSSWCLDLKKLLKNRSFLFSALGCAAAAFVEEAVGDWAPSLLIRARTLLENIEPCESTVCSSNDSLIFGILTAISGTLGIVSGIVISKRFQKVNPRADPLICAYGMLISAPFLSLALVLGRFSLVASYVFLFISETLLAMRSVIVVDIILYVIPPSRRSTAHAVHKIICHLLGGAGSPYFIGQISHLIGRGQAESPLLLFRSLQYSLMSCAFMGVIGGAFFMATALYIEKDEKEAEMELEDCYSTAGSLCDTNNNIESAEDQ